MSSGENGGSVSVPAGPAARRAGRHAPSLLVGLLLVLLGYSLGLLQERYKQSGHNLLSALRRELSTGDAPHPAAAGAAAAVSDQHAPLPSLPLPPANRTLRFKVCNGFANQRLGVMYGVLLAHRLSRTAVLPELVEDGLQRTDANVLPSAGNKLPFGTVYDEPHFIAAMAAAGVRVVPPDQAPPEASYTAALFSSLQGDRVDLLRTAPQYAAVQHLAVDCTLFAFGVRDVDEELMWRALDALVPSREMGEFVDAMAVALTPAPSDGGAHGFNFLHLRIENDWVEHCKRWESINDGIVRDNCMRNTDQLDEQLRLFGFTNTTPLYIACFWTDVEPARWETVKGKLVAAGYPLFKSDDVWGLLPARTRAVMEKLGRERKAALEYFLGLRAARFIGNSVSTFAALGLAERRHHGQWAAHYNGGNIPLGSVVPPIVRLPWIFTYNSYVQESYLYMLRGAVRSALATRSLKPYCIFRGNRSSVVYQWLAANGVTMVLHEPAWRAKLVAMAGFKANMAHSHLFRSPESLVGTFQRVDLPMVDVLDQYTYVLYTDTDVFFRRPVRLDDFGLPLPVSISMSHEMDKVFPYNAGIIVANLPAMRARYTAFIAMMLDPSASDGLFFPGYGPADQGILNKFYEADVRGRMLDQRFNAKPYNPYDPSAAVVHFHGPKPHELLDFLNSPSGSCAFHDLCARCLRNAMCSYVREWAPYVQDEPSVVQLQSACAWLANPVLSRLRGVTRRAQ